MNTISLILCLFIILSANGYILFPNSRSLIKDHKNVDTAIILLQGASIAPRNYKGLAQAIQANFGKPCWVIVPETVFETPLSFLGAGKMIEWAKEQLISNGMDSNASIFLGGHSLGGLAVQEYAHKHPSFAKGVFLIGSALMRKFVHEDSIKCPVISINGELDSQFKPMRSAEAFYHLSKLDNFLSHRPVVVISLLTHMAAASYDSIPFLVEKSDLQPIVPEDDAHQALAVIISAFLSIHSEIGENIKDNSQNTLQQAIDKTGRFLKPLISSLELEANYHLKKPCNSDKPSPHCPFYPQYPPSDKMRELSEESDCYCGSPVAIVANAIMADVDSSKYTVETVDAFHNVAETKPIHLPNIWNDCSNEDTNCVLNATTVSQNVYDFLDENFDVGTTHVAATEIRIKMKSRQAVLQKTSNANASELNYKDTDSGDKCRSINEKIYKMMLKMTDSRRLSFYEKYGVKMQFDNDYAGSVPAGPLWIYNPLHFELKGEKSDLKMHVVSPTFVTKTDTIFNVFSPYVGGMHYCKIISPARVMEWIFTDSLSFRLGLKLESFSYTLKPFE